MSEAVGAPDVEAPWVMITDHGAHPPEAWAEITARDLVRGESEGAPRLRKRIVVLVTPVFRLVTNGMPADRLPAMTAVAAHYIENAFADSPWPDHLASAEAKRDLRILVRRFVDMAHEAAPKGSDA